MKKSLLKEYSFELSLMGIEVYINMKQQKEYDLSRQFIKAVTSIGANIHEAYDAESKKDFIHKLSISLKEAKETDYWIRLFNSSRLVNVDTRELNAKLKSVTALLISIIKSSKRNLKE